MPDFEWEDKCRGIVCGIDEAGRGPWAGPVVAGAVIIKDRNLHPDLLSGLDDSKKLSAKKREKLYSLLFEEEKNGKVEIGIGEASCAEIDEYNILNATFMAMERARAGLKTPPELALVDGIRNRAGLTAPRRRWLRAMRSLIPFRRLQSWQKFIVTA